MLTVFVVIAVVLLYIDYRQTLDIKNHAELEESNVVLGDHPSDKEITIYFIGATAIMLFGVYVFPNPYDYVLAIAVCLLEAYVTANNKKIGLKA